MYSFLDIQANVKTIGWQTAT